MGRSWFLAVSAITLACSCSGDSDEGGALSTQSSIAVASSAAPSPSSAPVVEVASEHGSFQLSVPSEFLPRGSVRSAASNDATEEAGFVTQSWGNPSTGEVLWASLTIGPYAVAQLLDGRGGAPTEVRFDILLDTPVLVFIDASATQQEYAWFIPEGVMWVGAHKMADADIHSIIRSFQIVP